VMTTYAATNSQTRAVQPAIGWAVHTAESG
jgi:hypothetical protein